MAFNPRLEIGQIVSNAEIGKILNVAIWAV